MSTIFLGSPHTMNFVAFSCTIGNSWGNPCISHIMKYTVGWESYGEKSTMLWETYEYQFPRLSPCHGFCCIFLYCGKFMGTHTVPICLKYCIRWELDVKKAPRLWEMYDYWFPRFPHTMGFVAFSRTVGNSWGNPCISHMMTSVNYFLWYCIFISVSGVKCKR